MPDNKVTNEQAYEALSDAVNSLPNSDKFETNEAATSISTARRVLVTLQMSLLNIIDRQP